ncbi:MAG TPA: bifunctional phosphopantothenoylcysteine decarboxylase/phosphopantothenate--cysteine ligase CoaBC [Candidatus Acidoferrales bacterium]|nr:bifunctional phosphopantothenoylcysteine decarboxylase/phosphopantothenate--cysteine ligase CoaBC [Candidatus Acidoferrales bacterium]
MRVAVGVTGGVAAYKAAELVRLLQQEGLEVEVVMTRAAREFITPLTFAALTGRKVITEMFGAENGAPANVESAIEHIAVAQRIDALVIAPATADFLARMANGLADDFLSTLVLATKAHVIVAPAMNVNMWEHAATQENLGRLRARGVRVVEPGEGYLACGMTGAGRLAEVEAIASAVCETLGLKHDLQGETLLITAGPTREEVDPVRYLTNRSSGKMGYALAEVGLKRRARVILVSGPVALAPPQNAEFVPVQTAEQMRKAVFERLPEATVVLMAAAVADYRPAKPSAQKIKRGAAPLTLELAPTPDILAEIAMEKGNRTLVGFAAETSDLAENARTKLTRKGADIVVANDVTRQGAGFDVDTNIVTLVRRDGSQVELPQMSKQELASRLLDEVVALRRAARQGRAS